MHWKKKVALLILYRANIIGKSKKQITELNFHQELCQEKVRLTFCSSKCFIPKATCRAILSSCRSFSLQCTFAYSLLPSPLHLKKLSRLPSRTNSATKRIVSEERKVGYQEQICCYKLTGTRRREKVPSNQLTARTLGSTAGWSHQFCKSYHIPLIDQIWTKKE